MASLPAMLDKYEGHEEALLEMVESVLTRELQHQPLQHLKQKQRYAAKQALEESLTALYRQVAPAKACPENVEKVLAHFHGNELLLLEGLENKYKDHPGSLVQPILSSLRMAAYAVAQLKGSGSSSDSDCVSVVSEASDWESDHVEELDGEVGGPTVGGWVATVEEPLHPPGTPSPLDGLETGTPTGGRDGRRPAVEDLEYAAGPPPRARNGAQKEASDRRSDGWRDKHEAMDEAVQKQHSTQEHPGWATPLAKPRRSRIRTPSPKPRGGFRGLFGAPPRVSVATVDDDSDDDWAGADFSPVPPQSPLNMV